MQKQLSTFTWRIFNHKKDDFQKVGISFRSRSGEHFLVGSFRWFVSLVRFVGSFRWFVSLVRFVGKSEHVKCFIEPEKLSIRVFAFLAGTQGFAAVLATFAAVRGEHPVSFFLVSFRWKI
jgi:hypothetical protein